MDQVPGEAVIIVDDEDHAAPIGGVCVICQMRVC
jgi:hypothetical protein